MLNGIGEYQGKQVLCADRLTEALKTMRGVAQVESAESSNRIEGIAVPRRRVLGLVIEGTAPQNRSEQEIAGYRDALALVHKAAADMEATANVVRQLHTIMCRYLPQPGGHWKMVDNAIASSYVGGNQSYGARLRAQEKGGQRSRQTV